MSQITKGSPHGFAMLRLLRLSVRREKAPRIRRGEIVMANEKMGAAVRVPAPAADTTVSIPIPGGAGMLPAKRAGSCRLMPMCLRISPIRALSIRLSARSFRLWTRAARAVNAVHGAQIRRVTASGRGANIAQEDQHQQRRLDVKARIRPSRGIPKAERAGIQDTPLPHAPFRRIARPLRASVQGVYKKSHNSETEQAIRSRNGNCFGQHCILQNPMMERTI